MIRLNMIVEGSTEEAFVRDVLTLPLAGCDVFASVRRVLTSVDRRRPDRQHKGGVVRYAHLERDLRTWLAEDRGADARFTTMIDLYALPGDFPGQQEAARGGDPYRRVELLENALAASIGDPGFVPYIQLHEFETLLLVDLAKFGELNADYGEEVASLQRELEGVNPELVDGGSTTAPSKRIEAALPIYGRSKVLLGPSVAARIGLARLRECCRHFDAWLGRLERLGVS